MPLDSRGASSKLSLGAVFGCRSSTNCADQFDCIDLRNVVHPTRFVSNLPKCVTTMHSSDSAYNLPPFPAFPSIERFVGLGSVQDAVDRIERSIQARDAISVVIGPPGTGKTLISELLASRHQKNHRVIRLGETPLPDSDSFLRRVLHQAGADITSIPGGDLQLALFDHICLSSASEPRLLLLIDEAQSLTPELLETIRTLTNLTRDGEPRVSVVMFGGTGLDELLIAPSMDGFRQRISTRCYLHPLNNEETTWYINQTIRNCGCDPDATITADAISAVHHACSGVPRLINQLLSHAIEFAADRDEYLITDRIIDQSWAEVQQLPSPMVDEPEINIASSSVEFGELDSLDTDYTPQSKEDHYADQELISEPTKTCSTHVQSESDEEYDAYDFEPDRNLANYSQDMALERTPHESEADIHAKGELHTQVWDDADDCNPNDQLAEKDGSELVAEAQSDLHLVDTISDESVPARLQYPQLATPALANDDELNSGEPDLELFQDIPKTQTNDELFGRFDEEEQINLLAGPNRVEDRDSRPAASLETVLPQEIIIHEQLVDINDMLNITEPDQIQYCDDAHQIPAKMHRPLPGNVSHNVSFKDDADHHANQSTIDSATLDFSSAHSRDPIQLDLGADQQLNECDDQETSDTEMREELIPLRHDDSDMLIIEDEVDIHRIDKRQTKADNRHMSIDYQRMLKRMRSKN